MATDNSSSDYTGPFYESLSDCNWMSPAETGIYQLGCFVMVNGFLVPPTVGLAQTVWLRSCLAIGSFCHILWAAPARCWPDAFGWNLANFVVNVGQLLYMWYLSYPVEFDDDIEKIFANMFQPFEIGKHKFRTLIDSHGAVYELDATGRYALEGSTPTGKQLALLASGRMRVEAGGSFLHYVYPGQFMDSPEWLAFIKYDRDSAFQVSVIADTNCRYIQWEKASLHSFLRREPLIRAVFESYIGKDITNKLYAINESSDNPPPPSVPRNMTQDQPILEPLTLGGEDVGLLSHRWEQVNSDDDAASSPPASPGLLKESGSWQSMHSNRSMIDIRASIASGRGADVTGQRSLKMEDGPRHIDSDGPSSAPESPQFLLPPGAKQQFSVSSV